MASRETLLIQGLRLPPPPGRAADSGRGPIVIDAEIEFGVDEVATRPGLDEIARDLIDTASGESLRHLETVAERLVQALIESYPGIATVELVLRCLNPVASDELMAEAFGVRHSWRRDPSEVLQSERWRPMPR
jgi:dihydroneopterin aldolase